MAYTGVCAHCGKDFSRHYPGGRYCSKACTHDARKSGVVKPCASCGADMYVQKHRAQRKNFCGVACHDAHQRRTKVELKCKTCGKPFLVSPHFSSRKYCSLPCRDACPDFKRRCWIENNLQLQRRKEPTSLELAGRAVLEAAGLRFSEQVLVAGKFTVDVMLDGLPIVIQWDGDYWHGYRAANDDTTLEPRVARRVKLDASQNKYMAKMGLTVLRFWEHEVAGDPASVADRVLGAVRSFHESSRNLDLFAS